jgi:hypothetical protein
VRATCCAHQRKSLPASASQVRRDEKLVGRVSLCPGNMPARAQTDECPSGKCERPRRYGVHPGPAPNDPTETRP